MLCEDLEGWDGREVQEEEDISILMADFLVPLVGKNLSTNIGDKHDSSIPGLGRSPLGGHGNPLKYSCLKNPMDKEDWQSTVHGVTKSQTTLRQFIMCMADSCCCRTETNTVL